jgi:TonB family protein
VTGVGVVRQSREKPAAASDWDGMRPRGRTWMFAGIGAPWIFAAIAAVALHAGALAMVIGGMNRDDPPDELGTNAIEVDYVRMAPKAEVTDLPAGPNSDASVAAAAAQEQHEVIKDADLPQAVPTDTDDPDRLVTPDVRKKPLEEKVETPKAPAVASAAAVATEATAVPTSETSTASLRSAAPERGTGDSARLQRTTWQKELMAHLEKYRRYPADRSSKHADIVVTFTLDRTGHVVSASITQSSGDGSFDQAALAMVRRADPVPAPPALVADEGLTFTLPVRFRSKDRK